MECINTIDIVTKESVTSNYLTLFLVTQGWWWFVTALFSACDYLHIGQSYKVQPSTLNVVDRGLWRQALLLSLFNTSVISSGMLLLVYATFDNVFGAQYTSIIQLIRDMAVFATVEEVGFYYSHRLFHTSLMYPLHKIHHEFTAPSALTTAYAHPLEHFVCNMCPLIAGPLIMKPPLVGWIVWWCVAITSTLTSHSGYHFPLLSSPEHHDFHHRYFSSNYGTFGILDWLHGTRVAYTYSRQIKNDVVLLPWEPYRPV